ncbi:hypothetical protein [Castellaniella sp. UC4442_H9]
MLIEIELKEQAYTPEAFAYRDYLAIHGHIVRLCDGPSMSPDSDMRIYFMGMRPVWGQGRKERGRVVHEYQSLSIPPWARFKDVAKRICNAMPSGRIFLNPLVRAGLSFSDRVPYVFRDMGISGNLFAAAPSDPIYDILYCGSVDGRPGLLKELIRLAGLGIKVLVVGTVSDRVLTLLRHRPNITLAGRLTRQELPQAFATARAGLNYTPAMHPFNIQTSTKTLEYCAAGLGVVSNRYSWIREFSCSRGFEPLWLDRIQSRDDLLRHAFTPVDVSALEWNRVLEASGFLKFLQSL